MIMTKQLQKRLERLQQRLDEAERKGEFEAADELKIELEAVKQVLAELARGA